jgi:RNA polymerase sigma factor (sigma-70 family)
MKREFDQQFVASLRDNDRTAQRELYKAFFSPMYSICKRYCTDHDDALEVLNAGFYKVLTGIDKYVGKGSLEGWIRRIIVNTALDHIRSKRKYQQHILLQEVEQMEVPEVNDQQYDVFEVETDSLYELIRSLPPVTSTVFNLYVFEDFSHKEIAEKLGISMGTSKWHLSNARQKLVAKIKKLTPQIVMY